ncbi:MAG: nuclear transport factor 2 family protein [Chitinophagaceae bacterium]|nr:MAG: nuclear transport factor 2 family protein [Chitinophagaceae bacterium]
MILKRSLILPAFLFTQICFAQLHEEVVKAEISFASTAKTESTKKAFLRYMDSTAVVFQNGESYNGMQYWNRAKEGSAKLLWQPAFFAMSASRDLGFTTGPWELRRSLQDSIADSGQYTTIWKKSSNGEWKFLVDLGVNYTPALHQEQSLQKFEIAGAGKGAGNILSIEDDFIQEFVVKGVTAYEGLLMEKSWLNTDGKHPIQNAALVMAELKTLPAETSFKPIASGVSAANDLGYVYGTVQYGSKKENYLRVWVNTENGWRILLQVIKK